MDDGRLRSKHGFMIYRAAMSFFQRVRMVPMVLQKISYPAFRVIITSHYIQRSPPGTITIVNLRILTTCR